jgi:uncharacterized protein DUF6510
MMSSSEAPKTPGNLYPPDAAGYQDGSMTASADALRLDGNAAGGVLGALFPFDMTMAMACCAGCGATSPLGAVMAYMHGMGTILRCPGCDTALIRVAHVRDRYYLDMRGMRMLQITETVTSA